MPLLVGSIGLFGGLGLALGTGSAASAAGPTVKGTYTCATPVGPKKVPTAIQDVNSAPATLPQGTIYVAQPQAVLTIPASLIKLAKDATLTSVQVTKATLNVTATGFRRPDEDPGDQHALYSAGEHNNVKNGAVETIKYQASPYTMTATAGGTATLIPANITLNVLVTAAVLSAVPDHHLDNNDNIGTGPYNVSGSNTLGPIDSVTSATAVKPITRTWEVASDGGIFAFGNAKFYGSMGGMPLNKPIVGMAATPTGGGYWEVASDGGIFAFGNAQYYGSMGGKPLDKPIVGIAATPTGGGYWEVASDGGIFAFGNAQFYGSMGGKTLNAPIVGIAATPTGKGYWEAASDGGIFAFGTAAFHGSEGGKTLNAPIVGLASSVTGNGYWEVASDGGLFTFGTAAFHGSEGGKPLNAPIVGMAATPTGGGYWEVAADGGIFNFGTAKFYGSEGGQKLDKPIVGMAVT